MDAAKITGLADGESIDLWNDLSGNGNDATAINTKSRPTFVKNSTNGLPVIEFDGVDDVLVVSNSETLNIGAENFSLTLVFLRDSNEAPNLRLFAKGGDSNKTPGFGVDGSDSSLTLRLGNGTERITLRNKHNAPETTQIVTFVVDRSHTPSFGGTLDNDGDLLIGALAPDRLLWDGGIAEILLYRRALTATERFELQSHLGQKWSVEVARSPSEPSSPLSVGVAAIIAGTMVVVIIIVGIVVLRRMKRGIDFRRSRFRSLGKNLGISLGSIAMTLVLLEVGLTVAGSGKHETVDFEITDWWICDETGCRFNREAIAAERVLETDVVNPRFKERLIVTNGQGFHDTDEFAEKGANTDAFKILVLGDSFTWGASADLGKSWVEVMEAKLQNTNDVLVWNLGIPATGTLQAITLAKEFIPIMEPDVIILGFFGNDFRDNLFPLDRFLRLANGKAIAQYWLDQEFVPHLLDPTTAYNRAHSLPNIEYANSTGRALAKTRLGTLLGKTRPSLFEQRNTALPFDEQTSQRAIRDQSVEATRMLLAQLTGYIGDTSLPLVVLHIPARADLSETTFDYLAARRIFEGLDVDTVSVLDQLEEADYAAPPNSHWNNSGHGKAAEAVLEYLSNLSAR